MNKLLVAILLGITTNYVQAQTILGDCQQLMEEIGTRYGYTPTCQASPITEQTGEVLVYFGATSPYIIHIIPDPLGDSFEYHRGEIENLLELLRRYGRI